MLSFRPFLIVALRVLASAAVIANNWAAIRMRAAASSSGGSMIPGPPMYPKIAALLSQTEGSQGSIMFWNIATCRS